MASSSSSRAHSTPMPVGPSILWPVKPKKSQSEVGDVGGQVGHVLGGVDEHQRAGGVGGVGDAAGPG